MMVYDDATDDATDSRKLFPEKMQRMTRLCAIACGSHSCSKDKCSQGWHSNTCQTNGICDVSTRILLLLDMLSANHF